MLARAYRDELIPGAVTRTSWALNIKSRTLRTEIDLPNPGSQLLPGMYAYANVTIERSGVRALPVSAFTYSGDRTYCWTYKDGRAVQTEVRTGVSDGGLHGPGPGRRNGSLQAAGHCDRRCGPLHICDRIYRPGNELLGALATALQ